HRDVFMSQSILNPALRLRDQSISHLPAWARELARKYYTKTVSTFILTGAVRDLQPGEGPQRMRRFIPLKQFLSEELFGQRDFVMYYDRASAVRVVTPVLQRELMNVVAAYDSMYGTAFAQGGMTKDPGRAFPLMETLARSRVAEGKSVAII